MLLFQFSHVNPTEVTWQKDLLDTTTSNSDCIPTRTQKAMKELVFPYLTDCINSKIYGYNFPSGLKKLGFVLCSKMVIPIIREIFDQ